MRGTGEGLAGPLLGAFWFLFFAAQGLFFSYYSLYLREGPGLVESQIGRVWACLPVVGMAAYPFWGAVADRTGHRARVLAAVTGLAGLGYAILGHARSFGAILAATALLAAFLTSVVPLATSVCMAVLGPGADVRFGRVRVWGTVGYLVAVVGFPRLLRMAGIGQAGLGLMFPAAALLLAAAALVACLLPHGGVEALRARPGDFRGLLRHAPVLRALAFGFAAYLCLHGPMVLFPLYVRSLGGDMQVVADMWIFMLAVEIPLVASMGAGLKRFGGRLLVAGGVFAGGLRWLLCGLLGDPSLVYPVQLLHGAVVAGLLLGGPLYVDAIVPERLRSTGQALWAMVGIGLGGGTSALVAGWAAGRYGIAAAYLSGGAAAMLLGALAPLLLAQPGRPSRPAAGPLRRRSLAVSYRR